jgi:hypothetical protein
MAGPGSGLMGSEPRSAAAVRRLAALTRARDQGESGAVVEETGSLDRVPFVPYQRIEAEVGSGRALIISIEPDETLSRAVYRLDQGQIDLATGGLQIGEHRDCSGVLAAAGTGTSTMATRRRYTS